MAETTTTTECPALRDDTLRHPLDAVGVGHRGSTVLLHDKRHR
jgi:hypothetical protein